MAKKRCSVTGCETDSAVKGMCHKHHARWFRHGDVNAVGTRWKDPLPRFLARADKNGPGGCWVWNGCRSTGNKNRAGGYGKMRINGRMTTMHKWAYQHFVGPVPDGKVVMHKCDVTYCVNPEHLQLGTLKENSQDMIKKGRGPARRLKLDQVREIKSLLVQGMSTTAISAKYRVHWVTINNIRRGRTWAGLPKE